MGKHVSGVDVSRRSLSGPDGMPCIVLFFLAREIPSRQPPLLPLPR